MEKKFKNSFGVTGTPTEIELFRKEAEFLGWQVEKEEYTSNKVSFNNENSICYYVDNVIYGKRLSLSTPSGWKEAISLASEVDEEERYLMFYSHGIELIGKLLEECDRYILYNSGITYSVDKKDAKQATKEDFDKQELLEEAKRRYPIGTKIRINYGGKNEAIIKGHEQIHPHCLDEVWFAVKEARSNINFLPVYYRGKYAEIIPQEEPKYTHKEWIDKISKA